jgi:hypothetical protein
VKTISQFLPLSSVSRRDAVRHYRKVHTRFARRLLREMDQVVSYHIDRADREFDVNGGWRQRPRAFRFVVLRFAPGRAFEFPPEVAERIVADHRVFLRELRSFRVAEEVVLDRLAGQTALQKYVFEYERPSDMSADEGERQFDRVVREAQASAPGAFGVRLVLANRVLSEQASEAVDEPGQRTLSTALRETSKQGFLEFYLDQREWAQEWFAQPQVRDALLGGPWALARGYRVTETCGLDRR